MLFSEVIFYSIIEKKYDIRSVLGVVEERGSRKEENPFYLKFSIQINISFWVVLTHNSHRFLNGYIVFFFPQIDAMSRDVKKKLNSLAIT